MSLSSYRTKEFRRDARVQNRESIRTAPLIVAEHIVFWSPETAAFILKSSEYSRVLLTSPKSCGRS